jgi:hypothetical protein
MSSILDALKKLEEEKAAKRAKEGGYAQPPVESLTPVPDLRRAPHHAGNPASMNPRTLLLGIGAMSIALVAISVTVSVFLLRPSPPAVLAQAPPSAPAAAPTPAPVEATVAPVESPAVPAPEVVAAPAPEAAAPQPAAPLAPKPAPEPVPAASEAPAPAPSQPAAPAPAPKPVPVVAAAAPAPEPEPEPEPTPLPTLAELTRAPEPEPAPAPAPAPESLRAKDVAPVEDLKALPELRSTDRMRHGLEAMRINFLRESAPQRPAAMAVINLNKIHIGEVIPGTTARLVAVERHGIGIEITSTGDRFYVPL